jgi:hypothetical protein
MTDPFLPRIKAAQRDLIEDCGTMRRIEEKFGYSKSNIQRWGDAKYPDLMTIDAVRLLEADCGIPHVTMVMAEVTGRRLTDPDQEQAFAACVMQSHADLMRETAELAGKMALAFADGHMTPAEATAADRAAAQMEEAARQLRSALAVVKAAGGVKAGLRVVGSD